MTLRYKTQGTCSRQILLEMEGTTVKSVVFEGGCHGNLQGVAKLCQDRDARELIQMLKGIRCGFKATSCPDQLARALEKALQQAEE